MKCEEARKYFPYLKSGKKYFNHAAIGPLSSRVNKKLDEYLFQRTESIIENYFETEPTAKSAKNRLANMLSVDASSIAWSDSVSNSINVIAQGIKWKNGDQIILNDIEFPSNVYPFLNLKNQGVEVLFVQSENGIVDLPQIEKLVTSRTKLISISMVQFLTGYRADLKSIGEFCKKRDIIFCVDGIQGAGVVQINLGECNIDFFAGGTHKWLMSLQGLSYFYISENLSQRITQKFVGWTSVKDAWKLLDYELNFLENANKFQNGNSSRIGMIALDASLSLFEEIGYANIERQILDNSSYLINNLSNIGITPILENVNKNNIAGIVSFKNQNAEKIVKELKDKDISCTVREGMVRISPHFYNTKDDLDLLVDELVSLRANK